jgi:hypothetical protein
MKSSRFLILIALCSSLTKVLAQNTNLIASRSLKGSLAEVRTAIHTYYTYCNNGHQGFFQTNDVSGVSYSVWFATCTPPQRPLSQRTIWPKKTWPALTAIGWQPPSPVHYGYWSGTFVATRVSDRRTRLDVFKRLSIPQNDTEAAMAYLDGIEKTLDGKR